MLTYTLLKIVSMSRVVRVVGTAQNVNPEAHNLLDSNLNNLLQIKLCAPFNPSTGSGRTDFKCVLYKTSNHALAQVAR